MQRTTFTATNSLTEAEIDAFLSAPRVARMGSVRKDGSVHLTRVWYLWRDRTIYLVMGANRIHVVNARRDNRVSLCIDVDPRLEHGFEAGAHGITMRRLSEYTSDPEAWTSARAGALTTRPGGENHSLLLALT